MATLNDVINTTAFVTSNPIPEPLTTQDIFNQKLKRFDEDIYNTNVDSHLYKFLSALCGDAGAGLLTKQISYARFQDRLESTHFTDLDRLFGNVLGLPRLTEESYLSNSVDNAPLDPRSQALTSGQWDEVFIKDASYRSRCLVWTQALLLGGTPQGLALAAQAALSAECFVYENFYYLDAKAKGDNSQPNLANNSINRKQFVVVPQLPQSEVTQERQFYLYRLLKRLKPVGTIFTINYADDPRYKISPSSIKSSSDYFYITRNVTGNTNVNWPAKNSTKGYWIEKGKANPAPLFSFMERQEYSTFFTILNVSASEFHTGSFNKQQQSFFSNLRDPGNASKQYLPAYSYSVNNTPLSVTNPWTNGYNSSNTPSVINNYYPLDYFNISNAPIVSTNPTLFWASNEKGQGESDSLMFDLGLQRQTNYISFQICQKPIKLKFEYSLDNVTWTEVNPSSSFDDTLQIPYMPADFSPWTHYEVHFDVFLAQYIRVTFTRANELIYTPTNTVFNWSIEVKDTRIGHQVNTLSDILMDGPDYLSIDGTDILNNKYTTNVEIKLASNAIDSSPTTYWESKPNPSPFAVESLYFDLTSNGDGQIITEVYLDPITTGPYMHFYWSNDDSHNDNYDYKLWTPVNKHYVLKRGYFYLPQPIKAKYFKVEFSNLSPVPYNTIEYPLSREITYSKYPQWVQDLFSTLFPVFIEKDNLQYPYNSVVLNEVNTGFTQPRTIFNQTDLIKPDTTDSILNSIIQQQNNLLTASTRTSVDSENRQRVGDNVNIVNSTLYKNNIVQNLSTGDPVNRFIYNKLSSQSLINSFSTTEFSNSTFTAPINQSVIDLNPEERKKKTPILWFPYVARHEYQQLTVARTNKIAYIVGVKNIQFYRRDFQSTYDEMFYCETLDDTLNILSTDFTFNDWRFTVAE